MSAIRNTPGSRKRTVAHPYARQPAQKKSSWSLSNLFNYLNPLRSRSSEPEERSPSPEAEPNTHNDRPVVDLTEDGYAATPTPAHSLSSRGHQMSRDLNGNGLLDLPSSNSQPRMPPPPSVPSTPPRSPSSLPCSATPAQKIEVTARYLEQHQDQPITKQEIQGMVKFLREETPVKCNFSRSRSPTSSASSSSTPRLGARTQTPRKPLSGNPNGPYRWEGAGSAKPKNRYHSPAFGPSRSTPERLILRDSPEKNLQNAPSDTKRRRIGEDASNSASSASGSSFPSVRSQLPQLPRSPAPAPSPTRAALASQTVPFPMGSPGGGLSPSQGTPSSLNGGPSKANGLSHPTPRMHAASPPPKPTTPLAPSPLRQTWGQSWGESSSPSTPDHAGPSQRQTKAASFMTELIKEVTPPKKPDVSNPYQAASPVKISGSVVKVRGKRSRATGKPAAPKNEEPKKEKTKEYSSQAIIEATVPKGSKRARPPNDGDTSELSSTRPPEPSPPKKARIEEVSDDEGGQKPAKKAKPTLNGLGSVNGAPKNRTTAAKPAEVIDVDEPMSDAPSSLSSTQPTPPPPPPPPVAVPVPPRPLYAALKTSTAPSRPSKLRFSYQPESNSPSPPASMATITPNPPPPVPQAAPPAPAFTFGTTPSSPSTSTFSFKSTPLPRPVSPKSTAKSLTPPTFEFRFKDSTLASSSGATSAKLAPTSSLPSFDLTSAPKPAPAPTVTGFNWAAAGIKPPTTSASEWTCSLCGCKSPADKSECVACETPR